MKIMEPVKDLRLKATTTACLSHVPQSVGMCVVANSVREHVKGAHHLYVMADRVRFALGEYNYYYRPSLNTSARIIAADECPDNVKPFPILLRDGYRKPRLSRAPRYGKQNSTGKYSMSQSRHVVRVRGLPKEA